MEDNAEDEILRNLKENPSNYEENGEDDDDLQDNNLMFDKEQVKKNLKEHMHEENFYDPLLDLKEEEWADRVLSN